MKPIQYYPYQSKNACNKFSYAIYCTSVWRSVFISCE